MRIENQSHLISIFLILTLVCACSGDSKWKAVEVFIAQCVEELNAGEMPKLGSSTTEESRAEIASLRNSDLPSAFAIERIDYFGAYMFYVTFDDGRRFYCVVVEVSPKSYYLEKFSIR